MTTPNQLDQLIATYNEMLQRCHDALAPTAKQADRNQLREAIGQYLEAHSKGDEDSTSLD